MASWRSCSSRIPAATNAFKLSGTSSTAGGCSSTGSSAAGISSVVSPAASSSPPNIPAAIAAAPTAAEAATPFAHPGAPSSSDSSAGSGSGSGSDGAMSCNQAGISASGISSTSAGSAGSSSGRSSPTSSWSQGGTWVAGPGSSTDTASSPGSGSPASARPACSSQSIVSSSGAHSSTTADTASPSSRGSSARNDRSMGEVACPTPDNASASTSLVIFSSGTHTSAAGKGDSRPIISWATLFSGSRARTSLSRSSPASSLPLRSQISPRIKFALRQFGNPLSRSRQLSTASSRRPSCHSASTKATRTPGKSGSSRRTARYSLIARSYKPLRA